MPSYVPLPFSKWSIYLVYELMHCMLEPYQRVLWCKLSFYCGVFVQFRSDFLDYKKSALKLHKKNKSHKVKTTFFSRLFRQRKSKEKKRNKNFTQWQISQLAIRASLIVIGREFHFLVRLSLWDNKDMTWFIKKRSKGQHDPFFNIQLNFHRKLNFNIQFDSFLTPPPFHLITIPLNWTF